MLAKAAFIGGVRDGLALLTAVGADGLLIDDDQGRLHASAGLGRVHRRRRAACTASLAA